MKWVILITNSSEGDNATFSNYVSPSDEDFFEWMVLLEGSQAMMVIFWSDDGCVMIDGLGDEDFIMSIKEQGGSLFYHDILMINKPFFF